MSRPSGLTGVALILCAFNTAGFFTLRDQMSKSYAMGMISGLIMAYFFIFLFWEGHNGARILVLIRSFLSLFMPLLLKRASPLEGSLIVMQFMMAIFLLFWLNTSDVRNYFKMRT
jgi:hypothetical protein